MYYLWSIDREMKYSINERTKPFQFIFYFHKCHSKARHTHIYRFLSLRNGYTMKRFSYKIYSKLCCFTISLPFANASNLNYCNIICVFAFFTLQQNKIRIYLIICLLYSPIKYIFACCFHFTMCVFVFNITVTTCV